MGRVPKTRLACGRSEMGSGGTFETGGTILGLRVKMPAVRKHHNCEEDKYKIVDALSGLEIINLITAGRV